MQNFGRGMWRRVGDYQKQQQQQEHETSRLMHYIRLQKQRAIDTYNRMKKTDESDKTDKSDKTDEVKEEVTIVELISEPDHVSEEVVEVIRQPENVINNDITVVDFVSEPEMVISEPETTIIEPIIDATTSKKKRKKNSGKV
jgi:hypothetical protein